tara:strand:+ start:7634 stop:7999 length:366 start_codon:yes stop_codon:yes gene_type:complete
MLEEMFFLRERFMSRLTAEKPDQYPTWPIDLSDKRSQQHVRDMALRGVEEMFEALQHLKNWKPHRDTEVREFDKEEFIEEIVDAFNYFLSVLVLTGVSAADLHNAYLKKDSIIHDRLENGY